VSKQYADLPKMLGSKELLVVVIAAGATELEETTM
jgi:hypothetical protein